MIAETELQKLAIAAKKDIETMRKTEDAKTRTEIYENSKEIRALKDYVTEKIVKCLELKNLEWLEFKEGFCRELGITNREADFNGVDCVLEFKDGHTEAASFRLNQISYVTKEQHTKKDFENLNGQKKYGDTRFMIRRHTYDNYANGKHAADREIQIFCVNNTILTGSSTEVLDVAAEASECPGRATDAIIFEEALKEVQKTGKTIKQAIGHFYAKSRVITAYDTAKTEEKQQEDVIRVLRDTCETSKLYDLETVKELNCHTIKPEDQIVLRTFKEPAILIDEETDYSITKAEFRELHKYLDWNGLEETKRRE